MRTEIDMTTMTEALETLKNNMIADYESWQTASGKPRTEIQARMLDEFINGIEVAEGSKYIKVITKSGSQRCVWGFIVKGDNDKKFRKGDLLKAAGWAAPARNAARGNILDGGYTIRWTGPLYL
jgi:aspartyl-tRNA synthetase